MYISNRPNSKSMKAILSVMFLLVCTCFLAGCNIHQETDVVYRGPAPTIKVIDRLKSMGIKSIVSVRNRPTQKKQEYAEKIGMKWFAVKTSVMHSPKEEDIRKFLSIVNNPENQPVYVCCMGGIDRSRFYITAYKIAVLNHDPQDAVSHMDGSTWHKLWPGFRYYVDILKAGAKDKYGWKPWMTPETVNAENTKEENAAPATGKSPPGAVPRNTSSI
ncbi:MAG: hypothetical protein K2Y39_25525 [Candidatus Obscuribacterales bacterium]|nr:hypothetical protein [Candidatus Obscuribacterales bacterium]